MKRYSPNAKVPMKFHNLYVRFLNPLGILILLATAVLVLLTALNVSVVPELQTRIDGDGSQAAQILLWIMFCATTLAFLFAVVAETLLAKRRTLGVIILIFGYLLSTASAVFTAYNEPSTANYVTLGVTLLVSILVGVYYWKRGRLFH